MLGTSMNTRVVRVVLLLLVALWASAAVACFGGEPPPTPVAVISPTATVAVQVEGSGGLSPELTRRAADTFRQRDHMATLIAGQPTVTPSLGEELNRPPPGLPSEHGVWWYKPGGGDHTGAALLASHPYGEALDLLDGRAGDDYFPEIAEDNRELMLRGLVDEAVELVSAAESDTAGFYNHGQMVSILHNRMVAGLGWEVASTSEPYVRVWTEFVWDGSDGPIVYRAGAIGVVDIISPSADEPGTGRYVGRLMYVPRFSYYSDSPILERVASDR